ncbi:MAG: MoaD/ThiS family protein [Rhodospirillales bacterium]
MVKVLIWGSLKAATGGQEELQVEAKTIRDLLDGLGQSYPRLKPQLARGVSVSVDGKIYRDAWFTPIDPESEVVLLPRLAGG